MNARLAGLAASLAGLAACNPLGGTAIDLANQPRTSAGLWVETAMLNGHAQPPKTFCDPGSGVFPLEEPGCSQRATRTSDGALHLDVDCKGDVPITIHRRVVGDLSSAYVSDSTTVAGKPNGPQDSLTAHFQFRRQGACPPDRAPAKVTHG
jgi:hypothetical protein